MPMYSNNLICDILEYIDTFLYSKITIDDLEKKFFYNRYYIMKLFKKEIGITIFDYINKLRIYSSIPKINSNKLLINIAINNGFYSLEYFSETFKKEIGVSPKKFIKLTNNKYLSDDSTMLKITNNIINIQNIINFTTKYKQNRKRITMPIKKLSIFN